VGGLRAGVAFLPVRLVRELSHGKRQVTLRVAEGEQHRHQFQAVRFGVLGCFHRAMEFNGAGAQARPLVVTRQKQFGGFVLEINFQGICRSSRRMSVLLTAVGRDFLRGPPARLL
jgi:hypothetical protein